VRIAILNWRDSSHPEAGGAELYSESVARELAAEGHDVTLVTSRPAATAPRERRDGYRVVRRGGRFTLYPWVLLWLLRHRNRIDGVIDSQNGIPFFSPLVVGRRVPVVLLMHHVHQDQFALYFGPLVARVGRWLESTAARRVYGRRTVAAVSPSTRAAVRTRLRLRGPVHLAPCGLGEAAAPSVTVRGSVPRIVCVGRLVPHKRLDLLLDALPAVLARVPGLVVDLVGDGQDRDALAARAARLGLGDAVTVHGRLPDAERDALLAAAWLTVNPTQGEGWGLSVLEANRAGVPAVAFTVEGLRDSVLPGETGWLVEEDGPGGRAGRVERLADTVSGALDDLTDPAALPGCGGPPPPGPRASGGTAPLTPSPSCWVRSTLGCTCSPTGAQPATWPSPSRSQPSWSRPIVPAGSATPTAGWSSHRPSASCCCTASGTPRCPPCSPASGWVTWPGDPTWRWRWHAPANCCAGPRPDATGAPTGRRSARDGGGAARAAPRL